MTPGARVVLACGLLSSTGSDVRSRTNGARGVGVSLNDRDSRPGVSSSAATHGAGVSL